MKTIEQLAREATENAPLYGRKEFTFSARELETFRRLAIEDFVAGLEPVGIVARHDPEVAYLHPRQKPGMALYSLEGVKK